MNKKGDYKYGIVLSLILGLIILALSLFFIFNEYFTGEDQDREICRQSIQLRAALPESEYQGFTLNSFRDNFPLKCKQSVRTIDDSNIGEEAYRDVQKIIAEAVAECWALYDKGTTSAFPSDIYGATSTCVPCTRIHLTEAAKKSLRDKGIENISIRNSLDEMMTKDYSYLTYLKNSGGEYSAFGSKYISEFLLEENAFEVGEEGVSVETGLFSEMEARKVSLPSTFYFEKGDLLINYGITSQSTGWYTPYLFYFQAKQEPNPFDEVEKKLYSWTDVTGLSDISYSNFCESWEGIPA